VPQNGECLIFDQDSNTSMVNDLTGLTVSGLFFQENDYELNGNLLTIARGPSGCSISGDVANTVGNSRTVTINCGLALATDLTVVTGFGSDPYTPGFSRTITLHLNGPISLNGHNLDLIAATQGWTDGFGKQFNDPGSLYVSGVISGNGDVGVVVDNDSAIEFNGTQGNIFSGTLTLLANQDMSGSFAGSQGFTFNKQSGVVVNDRLVAQSAVVNFSRAEQLRDFTTVVLTDSQLQLNGHDETVGSLILTNRHSDARSAGVDSGGGTLSLFGAITSWVDNNQGAVPTIRGRLNLPSGIHKFEVTGFDYVGLDIQAQIVGVGGFSKVGQAALVLESSNTFSGEIGVVQGILDVRDHNALGLGAGAVTLSERGSLTWRNATIASKTLIARGNQPVTTDTSGSLLFTVGTCVWGGPIVLDTNLVVFADNTFLTGQISGPGGLDLRNGTVQLAGPAANTQTGTTLVRCALLQLNKSSGVNAFTGPLMVGGGTGGPYEARWLNSHQNSGAPVTIFSNGVVNLNNFNEDFGPVTFNGGRVETGTGQFAIYQPLIVNASSVTAFINGILSMPPSSPRFFNVADGSADPDLLVNATVLGGAPDLFKQGPGTMRLNGLNSYTGVTVVDEGVLQIGNSNSLGSGGTPAVVHSNATLRLGIFGTIAKPLFLSGAGVRGEGAVSVINGGSWTVTGSVLLDNPSSFGVGIDAGLSIDGAISGAGPITKLGPGILSFGGADNNTYTGTTIVNAGAMILAKSSLAVAVPGTLILGPAPPAAPAIARFLQNGQLLGASVAVNANSLLDLNGHNQTLSELNLHDGGSVETGAGVLIFSGGSVVNVGSQSILGSLVGSSIAGRIGLPANDSVTFNVSSYRVTLSPPTVAELEVPAVISVSGFENPTFALAGLTKEGFGRMRLAGNNTYKGGTFVNGGTLQVDGVQPQGFASINAGARLQGVGTVGQIYFNGSSGIVKPGDSPGILTSSNFNLGAGASGTLQVELNGTTPGSGYDQINVRGTVTLTGITLSGSLNLASAVNDQFIIINNDGTDPVIGTFNGLPQNASLYVGDEQFTISYTGGTGNDVVLTRIPTPPRPVLAIDKVLSESVRLLWPTSAVGFALRSTTNLDTTNWMAVLPSPGIAGTNNVVTNAINDGQKFYRLFNP
jgi:autotransporter-associated beta strand protein